MKCARHILVYGALVWALLAPLIVYLRTTGEDNVARRLRALAGARLGASPEDTKSDVISIPSTSVDMIVELSREEERKDGLVLMLSIVSSAVVLAFCLSSMTKLYRERHVTYQGAAANDLQAVRSRITRETLSSPPGVKSKFLSVF